LETIDGEKELIQICRYKKTLMAKKAAALQAFQKTDLAIPDTILEDAELRDETELEEHLDDRSLEGKDVEGEDVRLFPAPGPILTNKLKL